MKKKININVAGRKFSAELFVLEHLPASTLGNAYHRNKFYDKEKDDYFLERHIPTFEAVFECCYIRREHRWIHVSLLKGFFLKIAISY